MKLRDILSMEVPRSALKAVVSANNLKSGGNSVEDYANTILIHNKTKPLGLLLAEQYKYAGRTAANWFIPIPSFGDDWGDTKKAKEFLKNKYGEDLFNDGVKKPLTSEPQVFRAEQLADSLVMAFTYRGRERRVLENYRVVKRAPQLVDYVLIHFDPLTIETRTKTDNIKKFLNAVLKVMDKDPDAIKWEKVSKLTDAEALELANKLKAGLVGVKAKMTEGIYATKEVTANPNIKNLREEEEYNNEFSGKPLKKQTLTFSYRQRFGLTENIHFVITEDGLNFLSPVTEDVISFVRKHIQDIKNGHNKKDEELPEATGI